MKTHSIAPVNLWVGHIWHHPFTAMAIWAFFLGAGNPTLVIMNSYTLTAVVAARIITTVIGSCLYCLLTNSFRFFCGDTPTGDPCLSTAIYTLSSMVAGMSAGGSVRFA